MNSLAGSQLVLALALFLSLAFVSHSWNFSSALCCLCFSSSAFWAAFSCQEHLYIFKKQRSSNVILKQRKRLNNTRNKYRRTDGHTFSFLYSSDLSWLFICNHFLYFCSAFHSASICFFFCLWISSFSLLCFSSSWRFSWNCSWV